MKGFSWESEDADGHLQTDKVRMGMLRKALRQMAKSGAARGVLTFPEGGAMTKVILFFREGQFEAFFHAYDEQGAECSMRTVAHEPTDLVQRLQQAIRTRRLPGMDAQHPKTPPTHTEAPATGEAGALPEDLFLPADTVTEAEVIVCVDGRLLDLVRFREWFRTRKIYGIKTLRELTGLGLAESKNLLEKNT